MATEFHAVSLKIRSDACGAAKALESDRFLSKDAPMLPLRDCDNPNCQCKYEHHDDRRAGPRRDAEVGLPSAPPEGDDRRSRRGRRVDD
jgi:hypothetical protein